MSRTRTSPKAVRPAPAQPTKPDAIALLSAMSTPQSADVSRSRPSMQRNSQERRRPKPGARAGTRQIAGHFPEATMRALKFVMAEEDVTLQALLDEAIHDLLVKKGRTKLVAS